MKIEKQKMEKMEKKETWINVFLILFLSLTITSLMTFRVDELPQVYEVGSVAIKDIKADQNYEIVDEKSTLKLRQEAVDNVAPLYDFDPSIEQDAVKKIQESFEQARLFLVQNKNFDTELESQIKKNFIERMGVEVNEDQYTLIRQSQFNLNLQRSLVLFVSEILRSPLILSRQELQPLLEKGFILRKLEGEPYAEEMIHQTDGVSDLREIDKKLSSIKPDLVNMDEFKPFLEIVRQFIKPNLIYNGRETDFRKEKAASNIKSVIIKIKQGESIIRNGDRYEPWHLTVIEGIRKARHQSNKWLKFIGIALFVNLVLLIVYYYASKYIRKFKPTRKDLIFLGVNLLFFMMVLRFGVFMASSIRDALPYPLPFSAFYYGIPVAAGAMLVRFTLNSEIALIFSVIVSLFCGVFLDNNLELTVYYLISSVFAAHAIAHLDKRSAVLLSGAYTGLINAVTILSLSLIDVLKDTGQLSLYEMSLHCLMGFWGGILTAMLVLILAPVAETLFNYTTDIKLLEMANLSHPLLKEMIVRTPGTYHHSQIVGILSEAGAQAIGANSLLARVASYYHDIGKMKKPEYFIENQKGENPHDKLAPSMSALIIEAHVKDGIQMAKEHKLPQRIADMIPQHQGTKLIGFFFNNAKKMEDKYGEVDERDFRYDGPKPQSREAGIIMMADAVEGAVRALPEKAAHKIQATVEKMVNQHFVDEQLDECDLTLRDLHLISEAFCKILVGIYHQRIEYPEGALLGKVADVHEMKDKAKDASHHHQQVADSNISPLFRKKD